MSECGMAFGDEGLGVLVLGEVGGDRDDFPAGGGCELFCRRLERTCAARADRDVDAFLRQAQGNRLADALAAARYQRCLSLKPEIHNPALFFSSIRCCSSLMLRALSQCEIARKSLAYIRVFASVAGRRLRVLE